MSKSTYNWLTNAGMILGILSAWLYQRVEVPHLAAIALAVLAAVLSIGTYFYDRLFLQREEQTDLSTASDVVIANKNDAGIVSEVKATQSVHLALSYEHEIMLAEIQTATQRALVGRIRELASMMEVHRSAELQRTADYMQHYIQHNNASRRLRYRFPTDNRLIEPEVEMSAREAAVCYKQIMRDIVDSNDDMEWDFTVDTKGLRVSGKRHHARLLVSDQLVGMTLEQEAGEEDARKHLS